MKNKHLLTIAAALAIFWGGIGYVAWKVWPPLLFTTSCEADRCDPMIGFLVSFDNPDIAVVGIDMLVTIAADEEATTEATGRAWLELARYYEKNPKLTADYFPEMNAADYYDNAALFENDDAIEWQHANPKPTPTSGKKWGKTHGNWSSAVTFNEDEPTCFITSEQAVVEDSDSNRFPNLTFFARASTPDELQLQYNADMAVATGSQPLIRIDASPEPIIGRVAKDGAEYLLFGDGEPELLRRVLAGKQATIAMVNADGKSIIDRIDLSGIDKAYADMESVCGIALSNPEIDEAKAD